MREWDVHVPHSTPERLVICEPRILFLLHSHLQIRILSDDENAAFLQLVTHECALPIYERRDRHRLRVCPPSQASTVAV